jgi:pyrroloquinoline-quinone synthase
MQTQLLDKEEFIASLRDVGTKRYHDKHLFHRRMNAGELAPEDIRAWVLNRFCYQRGIPVKDAAIISNCPIREVRRLWLHRVTDHDGTTPGTGGLEAWLRLGEACGLSRDQMMDERQVLPAVRFAVDAYVNFARMKPWPIAIASSLTELFAPDLMAERLAAFQKYYTWVNASGFDYFRSRVVQARVDSNEGLQLTLQYCNTPALQQEAIAALSFKCEVLWAILDAIQAAGNVS